MRKQWDNVKVAHSDEPTENYHLNLQLPSTLRDFCEFQLIVLMSC